MLKKEDAIRIELIPYGNTLRNGTQRTYKAYIYRCECGKEIRSQLTHLKKHSGKCTNCAQFGDPFRSMYNELLKSCERRNLAISISYEQFVNFTKIYQCHYCNTPINWSAHTKHKKQDIKGSRAYKLDRMNNDIGYHLDNCVVCCKRCNEGKSNDFSYEEWFGMTKYLRDLNNG